jgi:hypothetical protein
VAAAADASLTKVFTVIRLILAWCGNQASDAIQTGTLCDTIPEKIRTFDSAAGVALRYGSRQLAALKPFPRSIAVDALAGETTFQVPSAGWFSLPWQTTTVNVGDMIVTRASALHGATLHRTASCFYQLSVSRGVSDSIAVSLGLVSKTDTAAVPLGAFAGPCFHTHLMRGIQLTSEATGAVNDDISARQPVTAHDLLSAPVPAACQHGAGTLVHGQLPGIAPYQGEMQLAWLNDGRAKSDLFASGDLNGNGNGDAAAVLYCNAGGVSWPEIIAFYTHGPNLLGFRDLSDINLPGPSPGENAAVYRIRYVGGMVEAMWTTQQDGDAAATPTLDYSARLRWDGDRIAVSNLTATTEQKTADLFVASVRNGEVAVAAKLGASGVADTLADQFRSYPIARSAAPQCHGLVDPDLPQTVYDLVNPGLGPHEGEAHRLCLLSAGGNGANYVVLGMRHSGLRQWQVAWIDIA